MTTKKYFYNNFSLEDLPGEEWKDIPGHEGYYKISNLGRIRRLEGRIKHKNGYTQHKSEMILKPNVVKVKNTYINDHHKSLRITIVRDHKKLFTSPARLVYYCFVQPFDLKDKALMVLYKDGDALNISPENLMLGTQKEKSALLDAAGRRAPIPRLSQEKKDEFQQKLYKLMEVPKGTRMLSRYSLNGKLLETYSNGNAAAAALNIGNSNIAMAAKGSINCLTVAGFLWRRGNTPEIDMSVIMEKRWQLPSPLAKLQKRIGQYDFTGKLINTYGTIKQAGAAVNRGPKVIQRAISGKSITCAGFLWREGTKAKISVKHLKKTPEMRHTRILPEDKQVCQYDFDGKWIKTYASAREAAKATGITESSIYCIVNDKKKLTAGGFLWRREYCLRLDVNTLRKHPFFGSSALKRYMKKKKENNLEAQLSKRA